LALRALLTNPLAPDADAAAGLLDAILEANREHLPLFAR
jgi:alpha-galactosidase/6-phospho-beta-glucosidase family protein